MIVIICETAIAPEVRDNYVDEIRSSGAIEATRSEAGCISYDFVLPVDAAGKLLIIERWADIAAMKKHTKSKNLVRLMALGKKYNAENKIKIYNADEL